MITAPLSLLHGDYDLLRVRVADSTGMVSELDTLLDVAPGPAEGVSDLIALVQRLPVASNEKKTLTRRLQATLEAINAQDGAAACEALQDFIAQVFFYSKQGKKLTAEQAAQLGSEANEISALLGC